MDLSFEALARRIGSAGVRAAFAVTAPGCRLCGAADTHAVCISGGMPRIVVAICSRCGILFSSSAGSREPERVDYRDTYWKDDDKAKVGSSNRVVASRRAHLERGLGKPVAGLRILEVGVGRGEYAAELDRHGANLLGLEPQPDMAALLREKLGIQVESVYLEDFAPGNRRFDVVNVSYVLEHSIRSMFELSEEQVALVDTAHEFTARESVLHRQRDRPGRRQARQARHLPARSSSKPASSAS